jgi:hypothetical protein
MLRRLAVALTLSALASGCASLPLSRTSHASRGRLWQQAHEAFARDSFRVAAAAFQRLVTDHPRSYEGHEARFYLGVLALEPRSGLDLAAAGQQLSLYVAEDSAGGIHGYHAREAGALVRLVAELRRPCAERGPSLRCEVAAAPPRTGEPPPPAPEVAANPDAARLRREIAARDETIRQLQAELERIRNTLAPRRTPR